MKKSFTVAIILAAILTTLGVISEWKFPDYLELRIKMKSSVIGTAQVYFDIGDGFHEKYSKIYKITHKDCLHLLKFPLSTKPILRLRFDPLNRSGTFYITEIGLFDNLNRKIKSIALESLYPLNQIRSLKIEDKILIIETQKDAVDPIMGLKLEYPLSLASVYPLIKRIKYNFVDQFGYMLKTFLILFLLSWVGLFFAYTDRKEI